MAQADRLDRANQLFSDALELSAGEREPFLERECGADTNLRDSVLKLLARFETLGSFLETPAGGQAELLPGDVLDGHFRIVELLGRGGMGEVYRAEDLKLGEPVALKMVRAEWRSDPVMLARFRDEVRLARHISHPNVCRVNAFHTCERNGRDLAFFEMEYLAGDALAKVITTRGKFAEADVLRIAASVAAGLDAAHREGIIHRDLKPGNILLARDRQGCERPVITDFGLARSMEGGDGTRTQSGMLAGSPDYMAPEQYVGRELTAAVDIFAFGLIVYEMAAGRRPYPAESIVRSAVRRIMEEPPPLSRAVPGCPHHWDRVLARALSRDPRKRYSTAGAMVRELEERPSAVTAAFQALRVPKVSRRAWLGAAAAAAAGVASFFEIPRLYKRKLPDAPLIMLTPLESVNATNAAALDVQIQKGLLQSSYVRVLERDRMREAWKLMGRTGAMPAALDPRDAREIALREGAQFVFFGNLDKVAGEWAMNLRLELLADSPAYPRDKFKGDYSADGDQELLSAAAKAVTWIRRTAGESAELINARSRAPEAITTKSWEALREYTLADTAWKTRELEGKWVEDQRLAAEVHLKRALELDPDFALAYTRLADIQVASYNFDQGMASYQRAARVIDERNLSDRESLEARALFAHDAGQYATARDICQRYATLFPSDARPLFLEASCEDHLGHHDAALHLMERALAADPANYTYAMGRAIRLMCLGRFADAESQCNAAAKLYDKDWTDQIRAALAFASYDMLGVWRWLRRMKTEGSAPYQRTATVFEACVHAEQERWDEAEKLLRQELAPDGTTQHAAEADIAGLRSLAILNVRRGRPDEAAAYCRRVLAMRPDQQTTLDVGAILARAGDLESAHRCIPKGLSKEPPEQPPAALPAGAAPELMQWPLYWRGILLLWAEIALRRGDPLRAYRLAQSAPPPEAWQEWPSCLVRASVASGEWKTAVGLLRDLFANPAAYWMVSDISGPGFIREALAQIKALPASETSLINWASLAHFLEQKQP